MRCAHVYRAAGFASCAWRTLRSSGLHVYESPVVRFRSVETLSHFNIRIRRSLHLTAFLPGCVPQCLEIQHFGYLVLGWEAALHGPQAQMGREIPAAAVQLCQKNHGDEVQRWRIDQQRQGLPLSESPACSTEAVTCGVRGCCRSIWLWISITRSTCQPISASTTHPLPNPLPSRERELVIFLM